MSLATVKKKKKSRHKVNQLFAGHSAAELKKRSRVIEKKLLALGIFKKAETVYFYVSLADEVNTFSAIQKSLKAGKRIFLPRVRSKNLEFFEIRNIKKDLKKGAFGILEPKPYSCRGGSRTAPTKPNITPPDLVIVPGVVFDKNNHRIGRGKGFYDRFLEKLDPKIPKIGLAFKFQIVDKVPLEPHDIQLDYVLTG